MRFHKTPCPMSKPITIDLSAESSMGQNSPPWLQGRLAWLVAVWIFTVVTPGGVMLLVAGMASQYAEIGVWLVGAIPAIICIISVWAGLSCRRMAAALVRGGAQLACLYFCALGAELLPGGSRLKDTPAALAMSIGCFAVPTLVLSLILRVCGWRLVWRSDDDEDVHPLPGRFQFGLAHVFAWMTLSAVFLAAGTALFARFDQEPEGLFGGLGLALLVWSSVVLGGPTGILTVLCSWLILSERRAKARWIVALLLATAWLVWAGFAFSPYFASNGMFIDGVAIWMVSPAIGIPALTILGIARLVGWKMIRRPRKSNWRFWSPRPEGAR
jgi:hypothetical protein